MRALANPRADSKEAWFITFCKSILINTFKKLNIDLSGGRKNHKDIHRYCLWESFLGGAEEADVGGEAVEGEGGQVGQQHHLPSTRHRQVLRLDIEQEGI